MTMPCPKCGEREEDTHLNDAIVCLYSVKTYSYEFGQGAEVDLRVFCRCGHVFEYHDGYP